MEEKLKLLLITFLFLSSLVVIAELGVFEIRFGASDNYLSSLSLYYDGGLFFEEKRMKEGIIELSPYVLENSIFVDSPSLEYFTLNKRSELERNVGEIITVYVGEREFKGKLKRVQGGKLYLETNEGILVVTPFYYIIPKTGGERSLEIRLPKEENVRIYYISRGITWKARHLILIPNEEKLIITSFGEVENKEEKDFEGKLTLISANLDYYTVYFGVPQIERSFEGVSVKDVSKRKIKFEFENVFIPKKSKRTFKLSEGEVNYEIINLIEESIYSSLKGKAYSYLEFISPINLAEGEVFVYKEGLEAKSYLRGIVKGEKASINIGENEFIEYESNYRVIETSPLRKVEKTLKIKNFGEEERVRVEINLPSQQWEVLGSSENYKEEGNSLIYEFSLKEGEEKEINLLVGITENKG